MKRPIAISLSPNTTFSDVLLSLKLLFSPWKFFADDGVKNIERWFRYYFDISFAISFNSGRSAFFAVLKVLQIRFGDEVILQSFTCVAVPNSIIALGAKPVYVDIDNSLTMDTTDLERKITKKTKAILVQHTFGIPANLTEIMSIAKRHNLYIIEDAAHTIGGTYKNLPRSKAGKKIGTLGDVGFFSFGRDKAFSSIFGGMAITNNKELGQKLRTIQQRQKYPSFLWTVQQLLHPILFSLILPFYNFLSVGKIMIVIFQKLRLLSLPVFSEEKNGKFDIVFVQKLSNPLAQLAFFQLKRLLEYNNRREEIANIYIKKLSKSNLEMLYKNSIPFLRFPIMVKKRDEFISFFRKNGVYVGKWYSEVIDPKGVDVKNISYQMGSCPHAEYIAKHIVNLPTYPIMRDDEVEKVVDLVKKYDQDHRN